MSSTEGPLCYVPKKYSRQNRKNIVDRIAVDRMLSLKKTYPHIYIDSIFLHFVNGLEPAARIVHALSNCMYVICKNEKRTNNHPRARGEAQGEGLRARGATL
mmetsp:Transcript_15369/g.41755  ORF Transcript_15369/g.41755 Transcript_15369/m.41755 type:complete len:102 (-) Transcript_15369:85-390(-)